MNNFIYQNAFRYRRSIRWFLAFTVAAIVILLYIFNAFERLELLTLDYRFLLRQPKTITPEIVFIDMAEDSITAIGRWPWPRKWHAALVRALSDYHPRIIAFDVLFSESQDEQDDASFEEAIREAGNVYLPVLYNLKEQDVRYLARPGNILSVIRPIERFGKYLKGTGHLNAIPDPDGVLRRVPAFIEYQGERMYQFGLTIGLDMALVFKKIPLDSNNQFIINWQSGWGKEARHYSYIDVIRSYAAIKEGSKPLINLNEFRGKICLIGLTASGLTDIKPVPIEKTYPAIGINAMIINSVTSGGFIYEVPRPVNILLIILLSVLITLYLSNVRLVSGILLAIVGMFGYAIFSLAVFKFFNILVLTFYPMLAIFLSYSLTSVYAQIIQTIERSRLFKQATRDPLTSIYNIRHFNLLLDAEFRNASLFKFRHFALIMADVDNFKHINDTYGHQEGDAILKEVARIIRSKCRQMDVVARYGGEEFIVMLSGAREGDAAEIAEKIKAAVADKKFKFMDTAYNVTISLGVAEFSREKDKDELVNKVDKALYNAKHEGKNRVCRYSNSAPGS